MNILITAGNTQTPIDRVRCITNIFTGRTGARVALEAHRRGHTVTLVTSHPEVVNDLSPGLTTERWTIRRYRTFEDLKKAMADLVSGGGFDAVIHAAAVSDYMMAGIYVPATGTTFDPKSSTWVNGKLTDVSAGKVKSTHSELWMRMTPTPKLADLVRGLWGFSGTFVKFKLEVATTDSELRDRASRSRAHSDADLIVANTLEGKDEVAWIGDRTGNWEEVPRNKLPGRLMDRVEGL